MKRKTALIVLVLILAMICSACGEGGTVTINGETYTFEEYEKLQNELNGSGQTIPDTLDFPIFCAIPHARCTGVAPGDFTPPTPKIYIFRITYSRITR